MKQTKDKIKDQPDSQTRGQSGSCPEGCPETLPTEEKAETYIDELMPLCQVGYTIQQ